MKKPASESVSQRPAKGSLNQRKLNHISACLDDSVDRKQDSFAPYKLLYNALPEISLDDVSTAGTFAGKKIAAPLIISSMTGGIGAEFQQINHNLAIAAEALKIPLGLGSMKVMLSHQEAEASFRVRDAAPGVILISNLGLVSFNHGLQYSDLERIVDKVRPDVIGLHLNALQEAIQEDGDTNFRGILGHVREIVARSSLPVYVKECGGGIREDLVNQLAAAGVDYVDVSGNDGTSWAAVEGKLSQDETLGAMFRDFGLPTAYILEGIAGNYRGKAQVIASGGIRNGIQMVKALALGARYVSVARPFLAAAMDSPQAVIAVGERLIQEMRTAMFLTGCSSLDHLNRSLFMERDVHEPDMEKKSGGSETGNR